MRKFFPLLCVLLAAACGNPLTFDSAYASNKNWLVVDTDRKDWQGNQTDSCYRLILKFLPQSAAARAAQMPCVSQCCWRSEVPELTLDLNAGFKSDLAENGVARIYTPGQIKIKIKYSSFLGLISAGVTPAGAISRDGTVKLKFKEKTDPAAQARLAAQAAAQKQTADAQAYAARQNAAEQAARDAAETRRLMFQAKKDRSVDLVKKKYGKAIDDFLYRLDLAQRKKGNILINADKAWNAEPQENGFMVTCVSKSKLGKTQNAMKDYPIDCGEWFVDLNTSQTQAYDARADKISGE